MVQTLASAQIYDQHVCSAFKKTLVALGEDPKTAIYQNLAETFQIREIEIPSRIDIVEKLFDEIFGIGSDSLKKMFHTNLAQAIENIC
jgi:hypothetical protein